MKLKYSPCQSSTLSETQIKYVDENTVNVDGEDYSFDPQNVSWPTIAQDTNGVILSAYRDTELHLTVRRFYVSGHEAWDTGVEGDFNADS
jgi:hypothetical protein